MNNLEDKSTGIDKLSELSTAKLYNSVTKSGTGSQHKNLSILGSNIRSLGFHIDEFWVLLNGSRKGRPKHG